MQPLYVIRSLIICGLLYFASAAPSTPTRHVSFHPNTSSSTQQASEQAPAPTTSFIVQQSNKLMPPMNATEHANTAMEIITDLADHHSGGPRFLADTGADSDLSDNEAYYIGAILLLNTFVFFGIILYLLAPWTRMCSWFGNCKYNASGQGYYPAGLGHSLDDAARMMTTFNLLDRRLVKRSSAYVLPILKTIAEAYDKYERSLPAKEK